MDVGVALPQFDYAAAGERLAWDVVAEWARLADAEGLDSVWLADHLFMSIEKYGGPPGRHEGFEPLTTLAAVARITDRVRLGTLVLCTQLRPPSIAAKAFATIDQLSGGRVIAGFGAGWNEPEYLEAGLTFERPGRRLEQLTGALDEVRAMWTGAAGAPPCLPGPVQSPHPPLWVGGTGDRLLEVAAGHADGWNMAWTVSPARFAGRTAALDRACEAAGREPAGVARSVGLFTLIGEDESDLERRFQRMKASSPPGVLNGIGLAEWRDGHLVGTEEQVRQQLAEWRDAGVSHLIAAFGAVPFGVTHVDDLHLLASALR